MNTDDLLNAPIRQPQRKAAKPYGDPVNRIWHPELYRDDAVYGVDYEIGIEIVVEDGEPIIRLQHVPVR